MRSLYDLFDELRTAATSRSSSPTLAALRVDFEKFVDGLCSADAPVPPSEPPLHLFAHWIAQRLGRVTIPPGRYEGGMWRLVREHMGDGEEGFVFFFSLLDEFRARRRRVVSYAVQPLDERALSLSDYFIVRWEIVRFEPDETVCVFEYDQNGDARKGVRFYPSVDDAKRLALRSFTEASEWHDCADVDRNQSREK